jgi:DNA-binding NtrC family response regulator
LPVTHPAEVPERTVEDKGEWPFWSILIVDDEEGMRHFLLKTLLPRCRSVAAVGSAEEGAEFMGERHVDLIILDISLPGKSGIAWLRELREQGFAGDVIFITAFAKLDTAIEALRAGASDFILKPFRVPQIMNAVRQCHERSRLARENFLLRRTLALSPAHPLGIVGASPAMKQLSAALHRLAAVNSTVLLHGESGTGKELAAQALHALSARREAPFVPVNCGCVSPELMESELFGHTKDAFSGAGKARDGLFHYAQGGTLFLDEVAELPLGVQSALLRVLEDLKVRPLGGRQELRVDVRIVAATSRSLPREVEAGRFRRDLYYRLQVFELELPPLRSHKEDIPALVEHFVRLLAPPLGAAPLPINAAEMDYLQQYQWPGNVRELRNFIERSLILGELNVSALYGRPPGPQADAVQVDDLESLERRHILAVLESVAGDKARAAKLLGVSRRTLERRQAEWGSR